MYQIVQSPCSHQEEDHQGQNRSLVTAAAAVAVVAVADALAYVAAAVDVTAATMLPWLRDSTAVPPGTRAGMSVPMS